MKRTGYSSHHGLTVPEKAKRLVMAGQIVDAVNHNRYDKPGEKIPVTSSLMIKGEPLKYVSRGGLKLEKALKRIRCQWKDFT